MTTISQYAYKKNFKTETMNQRQAKKDGISDSQFKGADKHGDSKLSIEEIMANDEVSAALQKNIDNASKTVKSDKASEHASIDNSEHGETGLIVAALAQKNGITKSKGAAKG